MDRRTFITGSAATGSIVALSLSCPSTASTFAASAPVIDGNLIAPLDPESPMDQATQVQILSSGLTAFKQTLGGSGNQTKIQTEAEIADLQKAIGLNSSVLFVVSDASTFADPRLKGKIGIIPSFEAAEMLEGRLDNIDHFRSLGVLVMGLSYNRTTLFASGALSAQATGLTSLGRQAVARMNKLGVTVDISHSDERSSFSVIRASHKPVLITHAGCAAVQPHPRNKSDALLRTLADSGGVIGIFELSFLTAAPRQPNIEDYIFHLSHALNKCGEDHVGIGSDTGIIPFDTSPANMRGWNAEIARRKTAGVSAPGEGPPPFVIGLNRPDRYTVIADALKRRGYSTAVADKVLGGNFARVFTDTWRA